MPGMKIKINVDEAKVATTELRKSFNTLGLETQKTEKDVKKLEQRMLKKMGADRGKIALDKLKQSAKLTRLEVAKLQMKTGQLSAAFVTLKGGVASVGRSMISLKGAIIGLGVGMAVRRIVSEFREFEIALVDMAKVTSRNLSEIRRDIMALPPELGTATELMMGYYQVISAGVEGVANQINTLTVASKAGIAAHVSQAEVIKGLTAIVDAYGGKVKDAAEASDLLFTIEKKGKTEVGLLIPVIGSLASMAATLSITQDELGASLAQVTKYIGSTAEAATQLEALFSALIRGTDRANKLFAEYGGTLEAIKKIGFVEVLKKMQIATGGNVQALQKMIGGEKTALLGFISIRKEGFEPFLKILEEMAKKMGATDRAFENWKDTLEATEKIFRSTIGKVMIEMGEKLAPSMREAIEEISRILVEYQDDIVETTKILILSFSAATKGIGFVINTVRGVELVFSGAATAIGALGETFVTTFLKIAKTQKLIAEIMPGGKWLTRGIDDSIAGLESLRSEFEHIKTAGAAMSVDLIDAIGGMDKKFEDLITTLEEGTIKTKDWTKVVEGAGREVALTKEQLKKMKEETKAYIKLAKELAAIEYAPPFDWEAMIPTPVQVHTMEAYVRLAKELAAIEYAPPFDWEQWVPTAIKESETQLTLMEKTYETFLERVQGHFADTFYNIFSGQLTGWEDMLETMKNLFLRTLSEMAAEAMMKKIKIDVTTQAAGAGVGTLGTAAIGIGAVYAAYKYGEARRAKRAAEQEAEMRRLEMLSQTWMNIYDQVLEMIYPLDSVTKEMNRVNAQFDDWLKTLRDLGATEKEVQRLEEQRAEALKKTREELKKAFEEPLEDMIAKIELGPTDYERYKLENWYETQIDAARALGSESVALLREAYELSKKQLILKQQEMLLVAGEEATGIIETIGLTPMELQLYNLEKWRERMDETTATIQEEMDKIPAILEGYAMEIVDLQTEYDKAVSDLAAAEAAWVSSATTFWNQLEEIRKDFERAGIYGFDFDLEDLLKGIFTMPPGFEIVGGGMADYLREFNAARAEFEAITASLLPTIESIPLEIDLINAAIEDQVALFEDLARQLEETGDTVAAAYAAQLAALTSTFLGGLEDIIRSHTLSEYEQKLYDLNEWYEEQVAVATALGTGLGLVNYAYQLQFEALQELNEESEDFTGTLEKWKSVLESVEDQILRLRISTASPLTARERMALVQQEIAGYGTPTTPEDVRRLQDLWGDYLNIAQEAYQRPSAEYQAIYYSVLDALEGLKGVAEEQISEYEVQVAQLEAQERMVSLLEEMGDYPSLQYGTSYVPKTGPYILHGGEEVREAGSTSFSLIVHVNESRTPRATGIAVRKEFETFLKSPVGGKLIQQRSRGRV